MKLGDVLKKERERKKLTVEDISGQLCITADAYRDIEAGQSPAEEWGPLLALIAVKLKTPTPRLIAESGRSAQAKQPDGQCGRLIRSHRERCELSPLELANEVEVALSQINAIESGASPLETYAPLLLAFAEAVDQPIFNLFYPCGLPLGQITDYP